MADIVLTEGTNILNVQLVQIAPPMANLYGKVTDAETGYPIEGVKVAIAGLVVYTNTSGDYGFEDLEPGSYVIEFSKDGYETVVR